MMIDKMIVDDTVQKEKNIMNAGGLSPAMAQFLINDANKIISNAPQPQLTDNMTIKDLGQPPNLDVRKNANPHSSDYYTLGAVYPPRWSDKFK